MREMIRWPVVGLMLVVLAAATSLYAQQDPFRWMDFHYE